MIWLTFVGVLTVFVSYLVLKHKGMKNITIKTSSQPSVETSNLSISQARALVSALIEKGEQLVAEPATKSMLLPKQLGPITREFFTIYKSIRTRRGELEISGTQIQPSEYIHSYISIGHSEDWDVVQKTGKDEVFVVEGSETKEDEIDLRFPSIYHLLLDEVSNTEQ